MGRKLIAAASFLLIAAGVMLVNAVLVDNVTRQADVRDGGALMETLVGTANVKVEGEGPAIVLIHGFGAALDWWDEITPDLTQDHTVIRLDLLGHGGTEAPQSGYAIERQAALVQSVLDRLEIVSATIVGHSMGGEVAVALAAANPDAVDRLVLIDSPPNPERSFTLRTRLAFTPLIGQALWRLRTDGILRQGLAQGFAPGFEVPKKFVADLWQLTYSAFRQAHDGSVAYVAEQGSPQRLARLDPRPPLLVIFGAQDALIPVSSAKQFETVPGATLVMIDGAGHSPMVEKPKETLQAMRRFFAGTER